MTTQWRIFTLALVASLCTCLRAADPPDTSVPAFVDYDEVQANDGIHHGKILKVTREWVKFCDAGQMNTSLFLRDTAIIKHWAGVSDAAKRVEYAEAVRLRIVADLKHLRDAKEGDLAALAAAVDKALRCVNAVQESDLPGLDTRKVVPQAEAAAKSLGDLAAALAEAQKSQATLHRYWTAIAEAKSSLGDVNPGLDVASRSLSDAKKSLAGLGDVVRKHLDLDAVLRDAEQANTVMKKVNTTLLIRPLAVKSLAELDAARKELSVQSALLEKWDPQATEFQGVRTRLLKDARTRVGQADALQREAAPLAEMRMKILADLNRFSTLPPDQAQQADALTEQIEKDIASVAELKLSAACQPLAVQMTVELGTKLDQAKASHGQKNLAAYVNKQKDQVRAIRQDYNTIVGALADLKGENLSALLDRTKTCLVHTEAALILIKKDANLPALTLEFAPLVADVQDVRDRLGKVIPVLGIAGEVDGASRKIAAPDADFAGLTSTLQALAERSRASKDLSFAALAGLCGMLEDRCLLESKRVLLYSSRREASQLRQAVDSGIGSTQLDKARENLARLKEAIEQVGSLASALGEGDDPNLAPDAVTLGERLAAAIRTFRGNSGWLLPASSQDEPAPPIVMNQWQNFLSGLDGGRLEQCESSLAALRDQPWAKNDPWAERITWAQADLLLRKAHAAAESHDAALSEALLGQAYQAAPASPCGMAGRLELLWAQETQKQAENSARNKMAYWTALAAVVIAILLVMAWRLLVRMWLLRDRVTALVDRAEDLRRKGHSMASLAAAKRAQQRIERMHSDHPDLAELLLRVERLLAQPRLDIHHDMGGKSAKDQDRQLVEHLMAGKATREACGLCLDWVDKHMSDRDAAAQHLLRKLHGWLAQSLANRPDEGKEAAAWREALAERACKTCPTSAMYLAAAGNAAALAHWPLMQRACERAFQSKIAAQDAEWAVVGLARALVEQGLCVEAAKFLRGLQRGQLVLPGRQPLSGRTLRALLDDQDCMGAVQRWLGIATGKAIERRQVKDPAAGASLVLGALVGELPPPLPVAEPKAQEVAAEAAS